MDPKGPIVDSGGGGGDFVGLSGGLVDKEEGLTATWI